MSLIAHSFFPRSMFDMDSWFRPSTYSYGGPSTLDIFDPFDELDRSISRNLMWLDRPTDFFDIEPALSVKPPKVPRKYRVTLNCWGYNPDSIKTKVEGGKLIIQGVEGAKAAQEGEDYSVREFHKTYTLPENVETDKMVSFLTSNGHLVVEMPIREQQETALGRAGTTNNKLFPRIVDGEDGQKRVEVELGLPSDIDPAKVSVTCKDRDLIIKAEKTDEKPDHYSRAFYYQRTTLPANTDFRGLKCTYDNSLLSINAPLLPPQDKELDKNRQIPIDIKQKMQLKNEEQPKQQPLKHELQQQQSATQKEA